ncbi:MAG: hypothetical protein HGGPFJEG_02503 [Ignavibacteria bacterium]|nr:hypothetical protein [Ignavibacteria bacterium]
MKKLYLNIVFLMLLVGLTVIFLYRRQSTVYSSDNYLASIIDKNNLLKNTVSPRIIFVGASNLAFGIDSERMEKEFGMPVINMGIHGNLGLALLLNNVKKYLRKDDIVILATEYYLGEFDFNTVNYTVKIFPEAGDYVDYGLDYYKQRVNYTFNELQLYRKKIQNKIFGKKLNLKELKMNTENDLNLFDTSLYARNKFNSNGDVISHLTKEKPKEIKGRVLLEKKDYDYYISMLNDFQEYAASIGAKVYYSFPCYPESEVVKYKKVISEYEDDLRKNLKIEIINTPSDLVYPDSLFFDTVYHLNKDGRQKRTDYTINLLKERVFKK